MKKFILPVLFISVFGTSACAQKWEKIKHDKIITQGDDDDDDENENKSDSVKVGINVKLPQEALEVGGNVRVHGKLFSGSSATFSNELEITSGGGSFIFQANKLSPAPPHDNMLITTGYFTMMGGSRTTVNPNVLFGLGTENPQSKIHLYGNNAIYTQYSNTAAGATSADGLKLGIAGNGIAEIRQQENFSLLFYTNNIERARIDSLGRMGIGYANPVERLHVGGNILSEGNIVAKGNIAAKNATIDFTLTTQQLTTAQLSLSSFSGQGTTLLQSDNTGKISSLSFSGRGNEFLNGNGNWQSITFPADSDWQVIGNNLLARPSGNVGIGGMPTAKLYIKNDITNQYALKIDDIN